MSELAFKPMPSQQHDFTFLTNYAHVLLLISSDPNILMRELAAQVGITERAVQRIVDDLTNAGYLVVTKDGRRNRYQVRREIPLRHELERHCNIGDLISCVFPHQ
jgi:DNA-binding MarR family transcriptional regulator